MTEAGYRGKIVGDKASRNSRDKVEPALSTIVELMDGPKLTDHGAVIWESWLVMVIVYLVTTGWIIFADELFHLRMLLTINSSEDAELSKLVLLGRYIEWTSLCVIPAVVFLVMLKVLN